MKSRLSILTILFVSFLLQNCATGNKNIVSTDKLVFAKVAVKETSTGQNIDNVKYIKGNKVIAYQRWSDNILVEKWGEIPDGPVMILHSSGSLASLITYKEQERNGVALGFFEGGTLETLVNYKMGVPEGKNMIYYPEGSIHVESKFVGGKEIYFKQYKENGEVEFERGQYVQ